jgi:glycosyltransferase involved in cell wall biosynthesis
MTDQKILFVYQFLTRGGVEAVIFNRMAELARRGIESRALFFKDYGGGVDEFSHQILISKDKEEMKEFVQAFQPGWALHFDTPDLVPFLPNWIPGIKQAYEVHTTYTKNYPSSNDENLSKNIRGFIVPSESQAEMVRKLLRKFGKPVMVVPNGLNDSFFSSQPPRFTASAPVVIWIGRLEAHKNWMMFLKLVEKISLSHPQALFWMVGGSHATEEQQQILWHKIVTLQLEKRFRWFPEVSASLIPGILQEVSRSGGCLVSTSKGESFGLAVLEALASGCPVVVPDVGGMREIARHTENGYIYAPESVRQASQAIGRILDDPEVHAVMRGNALEMAKNFTSQAVADRLLETLTVLEK